jgi:rhamnosyltransferase
VIDDVWHTARQQILGSSLAEIAWFRWMQFWGTYQGYRHPGSVT